MGNPRVVLLICATAALAGCAHAIKVAPDIMKVERTATAPPRVTANVGYFIPPEVSSVEITTQGGGGDNVRYFPYRDIEGGYQKMLSNVFTGVVKLASLTDLPNASRDRIDYVVVPTIVTGSGGAGFFTWPPTNFTVDLTCNVRDAVGTQIASPRVVGTGSADTSERLHDYGFAGERAMEDALVKMQAAMFEIKFPSATSTIRPAQPQLPAVPSAAVDRLAQLKELKDKGLISEAEYEAKRKAILDTL
jgi:Short C-terminal domain